MESCLHRYGAKPKIKLSLSLGVVALGGMLFSPGCLFAADTSISPSPMPSTVKAFITKNCAACHHPPMRLSELI